MIEKEKSIGIYFGALCKPIKEQLNEQGYALSGSNNDLLQKLVDAAILLNCHGILPDSITHKTNLKILKKIVNAAIVINGIDCVFCEGTGQKRWKHRESKHHSSGSVTTCPVCKGSGKIRPGDKNDNNKRSH